MRRYYERCKHADSPAMRDPNPVVYLVPGIGMITFAKDKATARIAGEFYVNAINVMRGASAVATYFGLPEQEAFDIEYWLLEEAKLQRMPKPKSACRQGRASSPAAPAASAGRPPDGCSPTAPASCSPTSTRTRSTGRLTSFADAYGADAVRGVALDVTDEARGRARLSPNAVAEYGGLDILVSNAGISSSAPIEETELSMWNRNMDILADRLFPGRARGLPADEAAEARRRRSSSSPRRTGLPPRPDAAAYCTAKAAEIHLARCLALEGARGRHPGQRRQSRRGAARLEDLDRRMARAARRRLQHEAGRARGALSQALDC